ncbi:MAG: ABC transporter permease [Peptococcaceae bacterium]|jgi:NitT/TauT family transport system permease protein|nr:ABC transporter permease [Peptococcaceae bacterium]
MLKQTRGKRWAKNVFSYLLAAAVIVALWQLASLAVHNAMLPPPLSAWKTTIRLLHDPLGMHLWISTRRVLGSLLISLLIGVPLGMVMGFERPVDRVLAPLVYLTYPIPKIVFLPLILLFFGLGEGSKVFLISLIATYQILVTTRDAVRKVTPEAIHSLRSLGASHTQIYRYLLFPSCLPDVLTALRLSLGTAIAVLFFAESFATTRGLGYFIMDSWSRAAADRMFAGIIMMGLLGVVLFWAVDVLELLFARWRRQG